MTGSISEVRAFDPSVDGGAGDTSGAPPGDLGAAARADRAAAHARLQAFVSSGTGDAGCWNLQAPDHDYDHCVQETIPAPVLFQRQATDADAADSRDVRQGGLGDCHVLAPLAALAGSPQGRALIHNAVVENKNDEGEVVSYTVTLHKPEGHLFGKTTFQDVPITVDGPYVIGHARLRPGGSQSEVWPLVVEKAFAKYEVEPFCRDLMRAGVPAGPVHTVPQALAAP